MSDHIAVQRDLSINGTQIVSVFSKSHKKVDIVATISGDNIFSIGQVSFNSQAAMSKMGDGVMSLYPERAIYLGLSAANFTAGSVTMNEDSISIDWIKEGTGGIGTAILLIHAHYHD